MKKANYVISFSGGRTSGFMTKMLIDNFGDEYNFIVTFANTGLEHQKTLEFVHNCDTHFGFNTIWLEAVVHHNERTACTHKIVNFETASRNGEPFEEHIKKYGIPNASFPQCTRELKLNPMRSYLRSIGVCWKSTPTAIGVRTDEMRRVRSSELQEIKYPLVETWPSDKQDVLDWWGEQKFDLGIEEFEGNCRGCFKKSTKKHFLQIEKDPLVYDFHRRMERDYSHVGPQDGRRVFFRKNMSTDALFALKREVGIVGVSHATHPEENSGCSESCEVFETESLK